MKPDFHSHKADYIGITGSVLCLIHCLVTPVLLLTSAVLRQDVLLRASWHSLDYVFIGVNVVAVFFATRHSTNPGIRLSLWGFLGVFAGSLLLEERSAVFAWVGYAASFGLIITHLVNIRYCQTRHQH
jgi:MerC mercury resistance protein